MTKILYSLKTTHLARLFLIFLTTLVLISVLAPSSFLTAASFRSMAVQMPELGFLSIAAAMVLISGGIDLSVTGVAILSGVLAALIMKAMGGTEASPFVIIPAILAAVGIGCLCGFLNSVLVAGLGLAPMLATLGTSNLFTGLGIVLSKGSAVTGFPEAFQKIGNGSILGIPIPMILFVIAITGMAFLLKRTKYGFRLFMYGTNPTASFFSGINNTRVLITTYTISGFISSIAGILMVSRINTAKADYGSSYGLQALLIAVLGGIDPSGGNGRAIGLLLSIVTLQIISSGFNLMHINAFIKDLTWGLLLLIIMVWNYARQRKE